MSYKYLLIDDTTGKGKLGSAAGSGLFVDEFFDVGAGGQSEFTVSQTFVALSLIEVEINGRGTREGASYDFTRDTGTNKITTTFTIPENSWIKVRVYL